MPMGSPVRLPQPERPKRGERRERNAAQGLTTLSSSSVIGPVTGRVSPQSLGLTQVLGDASRDGVSFEGRPAVVLGAKPHPSIPGDQVVVLQEEKSGQIRYVGAGVQISVKSADAKQALLAQFQGQIQFSSGRFINVTVDPAMLAQTYRALAQNPGVQSVAFLNVAVRPELH